MTGDFLRALLKPLVAVIATGALATLTDYQADPHWVPALVDGGKVAALMTISLLGVQGAVSGAQTAVRGKPRQADGAPGPTP